VEIRCYFMSEALPKALNIDLNVPLFEMPVQRPNFPKLNFFRQMHRYVGNYSSRATELL
jgi:hypothetical protein